MKNENKTSKRLTLARDTIRVLGTDELPAVNGGWHLPTISCQRGCGSTSIIHCSCTPSDDYC